MNMTSHPITNSVAVTIILEAPAGSFRILDIISETTRTPRALILSKILTTLAAEAASKPPTTTPTPAA